MLLPPSLLCGNKPEISGVCSAWWVQQQDPLFTRWLSVIMAVRLQAAESCWSSSSVTAVLLPDHITSSVTSPVWAGRVVNHSTSSHFASSLGQKSNLLYSIFTLLLLLFYLLISFFFNCHFFLTTIFLYTYQEGWMQITDTSLNKNGKSTTAEAFGKLLIAAF